MLPDGFELLEAAAFTDVFGWNMVAGDRSTSLYTVGKKLTVPTSFGHIVQAKGTFATINSDDFCALALPGGFPRYGYFAVADNADFLRIIHEFAAADKPIAAVCTASILLGKAGILKNRLATSYQGEGGRWLEQLISLGAQSSTDSLCIDGRLITGSGPASAIPVALQLLEMVTSPQIAASVAAMMGFK